MKEFEQIMTITAVTSSISNECFLDHLFEQAASRSQHAAAILIPVIFEPLFSVKTNVGLMQIKWEEQA